MLDHGHGEYRRFRQNGPDNVCIQSDEQILTDNHDVHNKCIKKLKAGNDSSLTATQSNISAIPLDHKFDDYNDDISNESNQLIFDVRIHHFFWSINSQNIGTEIKFSFFVCNYSWIDAGCNTNILFCIN